MYTTDYWQLQLFGGEMANHGVAQLHVKRERGVLVIIAFGQGPRGQKYRKTTTELAATELGSEVFKGELPSVVRELMP
jgi:hypothetical protein